LNAAGVFVTGTDTGIGKTHASVALLRAHRANGHRAIGMKPVASGCRETPEGLRNDDAEALIAASTPAPAYALCNPFAFLPPVAPHLAAHDAGVGIALDPIVDAWRQLSARADRLVVEGVGGWSVPLSDTLMQADLVRAEECLQDAFATDVRPAIRDWRAARGLPADPLEAFREGGYLQKITAARATRAASPSSYA